MVTFGETIVRDVSDLFVMETEVVPNVAPVIKLSPVPDTVTVVPFTPVLGEIVFIVLVVGFV